MEWTLADLGRGWVAIELVALEPGELEIQGGFQMQVDSGIAERRAAAYQAPPSCITFWARDSGGEVYIPFETEPVFSDRRSGIDIIVSSPAGQSHSWSVSPLTIKINETHVGHPFYVLVGFGNPDEWLARAGHGSFTLSSTAPLEVQRTFTGPLVCTDSFDDFEGDVVITPATTQANDLVRGFATEGLSHIWFFAFADTALDMRIARDGAEIWTASLPTPPDQIHFSKHGLPPGAYALQVPRLEDSDVSDGRPWLRSLVLSGMAPDLGLAIQRAAEAVDERFAS